MINCFTKFNLYNHVQVPCIGITVNNFFDEQKNVDCICEALKNNISYINATGILDKEPLTKAALIKSGVSRDKLFISGQLWTADMGRTRTIEACKKTLKELDISYLDLYLMGWELIPRQPNNVIYNTNEKCLALHLDTWDAMIQLHKEGLVKAIGVGNCRIKLLTELLKTEIRPMVNRIPCNICYGQKKVVQFCKHQDILVESSHPFGIGTLFSDMKVYAFAKKYNCSISHLALRWCIQNGIVPLLSSCDQDNILNWSKIFDFHITQPDMDRLNLIHESDAEDKEFKPANITHSLFYWNA